jgi:hypothetical protein
MSALFKKRPTEGSSTIPEFKTKKSKVVIEEQETTPLSPKIAVPVTEENGVHAVQETASDAATEVLASPVESEAVPTTTSTEEVVHTNGTETVEDADMASLDVDKIIAASQQVVLYKGGQVVTFDNTKKVISKEVSDPTQYLLKLLGLEPYYWNNLYESVGVDLGMYINRSTTTDPASKKKYYDNLWSGKRIYQNVNCPGLEEKITKLCIGLPMIKGISKFKGPPFGDAGGTGQYDKEEGKYNLAAITGAIQPSNAVPCDLEDRPEFNAPLATDSILDEELRIRAMPTRLSAAFEWMYNAVCVPVYKCGERLFVDKANPASKPSFKELDSIYLKSKMFGKGVRKERMHLYKRAFGIKMSDLPEDHPDRIALQRKLAWTESHLDEGSCKEHELLNLPIYRLVMKDDEDKKLPPYSLVRIEDWRQCHSEVLDYDNDLFIPFVSPSTIEPGKDQPNLYHCNWNLEFVIWCGKTESFDWPSWNRTDPVYNPRKVVDNLFETLKNTPMPAPLEAEKAWNLQPGKVAEQTHTRDYQDYILDIKGKKK